MGTIDKPKYKLTDKVATKIGDEMRLLMQFSLAADIVLNDIINRTEIYGGLKQEVKQKYKKYVESLKAADRNFEAFEHEFEIATDGHIEKLDGYRMDGNELVRFLMLYIDRCVYQDCYDKIWKMLRESESGKVFSDDEINRFNYVWEGRGL